MLTIGEFSQSSRLTVKTLRYYQELGILIPAERDEITGYRYYDGTNLERAKSIVMLKELGFTLKEIGKILRECSDESDLKSFIERKLDEVEEKLKNLRKMKKELELVKEGTDEQTEYFSGIVEFDFHLPCYANYSLTGSYNEIGKGFSALYREYGRFALGKPYAFFYDMEYRESDAAMEAIIELNGTTGIPAEKGREFPSTRAVKMLHRGEYGSQGPAYARLFQYCRLHGYKVKPPLIEHYVKGPGLIFQGNRENYRTECIVLLDR